MAYLAGVLEWATHFLDNKACSDSACNRLNFINFGALDVSVWGFGQLKSWVVISNQSYLSIL